MSEHFFFFIEKTTFLSENTWFLGVAHNGLPNKTGLCGILHLMLACGEVYWSTVPHNA